MIGVGGHDEPAFAQAQEVVLAHEALYFLAVYTPAAIVQLPREAAAAVVAELQSNALDLATQFHVRVCRRGLVLPAIEARTADLSQPAELVERHGDGQAHLLFEVRVDDPRVVNACSLRCSSTCCKQKSISTTCWPTFRSSAAMRFSSARFRPGPVNAL